MEVIDQALLRRFEIKLSFELPTTNELDIYYDTLVSRFPENLRNIKRAYHISYAEAKDLTENQIKKEIILQEKAKEKTHANELIHS